MHVAECILIWQKVAMKMVTIIKIRFAMYAKYYNHTCFAKGKINIKDQNAIP